MKIRHNFVSNSSSTSFVVISNKGQYVLPEWCNRSYIFFGPLSETGETDGCYQFGWENKQYRSIEDKINFCFIQARDALKDDWKKMIEDVIKKETGVGMVDSCFPDNWGAKYEFTAYIDHQSSSSERKNTEMFKNKETLRDFIFNSGSYIQGNNDNED